MSTVKVGQIWKEVDPRFDRYVEVIGVNDQEQKATIMLAARSGGHAGSRSTKASLKRFNGKRGGYELHKDAEVAP
ncbi:MAG: hypothetical protein KKD97_16255 [Gammaproteobacteria bacterium]|nr:hypothetical protein [Gammaproteobacteria bacterium]